MWKSVNTELPEPEEDILFINIDVEFTCAHTGLPIRPSVIYGYRDKHQGGYFRSYMDVIDKWRPTHWMYTSDLLDLKIINRSP